MIETYKDKRHTRQCNNCRKWLDNDQGIKVRYDTSATCIALCDECMKELVKVINEFLSKEVTTDDGK